jgi:hypothetical protein
MIAYHECLQSIDLWDRLFSKKCTQRYRYQVHSHYRQGAECRLYLVALSVVTFVNRERE